MILKNTCFSNLDSVTLGEYGDPKVATKEGTCFNLPVTEISIDVVICRYMVGIAGPPGAGKSTVAQEVVKRLNELWHQNQGVENGSPQTDIGVAVPMDGFHLYRWQLDAMEVISQPNVFFYGKCISLVTGNCVNVHAP